MADIVELNGGNVSGMKVGDIAIPFSGVTLTVDGGQKYVAGDNSARMMEVSLAMGSQELAESILRNASDYVYRPYTATKSYIDPAVELGDGMIFGDLGETIYSQDITFGGSMVSNIEAPGADEYDHEFEYESPERRSANRAYGALGAAIKKLDEDYQELLAQIEGAAAGLTAYVKKDELGSLIAETDLIAEIQTDLGTVSAGLASKVSDTDLTDRLKAYTLNTSLQTTLSQYLTVTAANEMYLSDADVTSIIGQYIVEDKAGHKKSLVEILSDQIDLQGRVNLSDVAYVTASPGQGQNGGLGVRGSIVANGNLLVSGYLGSTGDTILLAGNTYTPQDITSTTGPVKALGR